MTPDPASAWGRRTHEIINRRAARALTGPAGEFWAPFALDLGSRASDADDRKPRDPDEPPRHYFDCDVFGPWPYDDVPRTYEGLVKKYGRKEANRWGKSPWAIQECYDEVVAALREGDWSAAGAWAADLGHYVGDMHQPLHGSVNYDGQKTGNQGIHLRFEVWMMDRHFDEAMISFAAIPEFTGSPASATFDWMIAAYPGLQPMLDGDDAAKAVDPDFGDEYHAELWARTSEIAVKQVSAAVRDLASLYAAAWREAGEPSPPAEVPRFRLVSFEERHRAPEEGSRVSWRAVLGAVAVVAVGLAWGAS